MRVGDAGIIYSSRANRVHNRLDLTRIKSCTYLKVKEIMLPGRGLELEELRRLTVMIRVRSVQRMLELRVLVAESFSRGLISLSYPAPRKALLATLLCGLFPAWYGVSAGQPIETEQDLVARRVQPCTGCHGEVGRATPDGYYPRVAGKLPDTCSTRCATFATA